MRPLSQQDGSFDRVLELPDIAGPVVSLQQLVGGRFESLDPLSELAREAADKELGELGDVLLPLAKRRHVDRHDVEAVVEVLAELPVGDHLGQAPVGRRDDTHVALQGPRAAEPLELVLLEHTQDLCLRIRAHVAHLVEEEAATIGLLEPADTLAIGAGEGPLLVTEQLRFEQVLL